MKTRNYFTLVLCFVLALTFMLTGCKSSQAVQVQREEKLVDANFEEYKGKMFSPTAKVTTFRFYGPQVKFEKGDDLENNVWYRAYEKFLGLKVTNLLEVTSFTTFDTRVMTAITTDSLPDIIPVYTTLFFRIAANQKFADLSSVYKKFADDEVKEQFQTRGGGLAYKTCFIDGKLQAMATPTEVNTDFLWIRNDWLTKYGLSWPKNINETINIMKKFHSENAGGDTYGTMGMPIDKNLAGLNGFANAFGAYKGTWIDDGNGGLVRGEIRPEWKTVLGHMQQFYKDDVIDREFTYKAGNELEMEYTSERFGVVFSGQSAPDGSLNNSVEANSKAEWLHKPIMDVNGNPAKVQFTTRISNFTGMNKKSKYPEAIILLNNIWADLMHGKGAKFQKYHDFIGKDKVHYDSFFYPIVGGLGAIDYYNAKSQELVSEALISGDSSQLNGEQLGYLDRMTPWHKDKDPIGWRMYAIFGPGGSTVTQQEILKNGYCTPDLGWGPETQAWIDNGPDLSSKLTEKFTLIISGQTTVDEGFQQWVEYFNANGGAKATEEINAWWKETGKEGMKDYVLK